MTGPTLEEICAVRTDDDWARLMLRKFRPTGVQLALVLFCVDVCEYGTWSPFMLFGEGDLSWDLPGPWLTLDECDSVLFHLAEFVSLWLPGGYPEHAWPEFTLHWGAEGIDRGGMGWPS